MRIMKKSMIIVLLLVSYMSIGSVLGQSTTTVDVDVISYFDGTEITNTVSDVPYGNSLSFEGQLTSQNNYEFGYFIVNNVVEEYLSTTYDFVVKNEMNIKAIFTPTDKHVVLFRDSNGELLDIEYVTNGSSVSDAEVTLPDKPGMVVSTSKWDTSLDNIVSNTVITLQYDLDTSLSFDLVVTNGSGDSTYAFNSEVIISAPLTSGSESFSHFEENGQIISRKNETSITMLGNRNITAVYTDSDVSDAPFVSLSDDLELRGGYSSFMGYYYIPDGMSLVEYGMISSSNELFDLSSVGVVLHQGEITNPDTDEYLFSFNSENYVYVRGYAVFKDSSDNIIEIYSDTKACTGEVAEEVLFYETGFEDGSKGSYTTGVVTLSGNSWTLNNTLIGALDNDQFNDTKATRMKMGDIESEFTVTNLGKISFYHGRYLGDDPSTFDLDISVDGTNWVTVDSNVLADTAFTFYEFTFTDTVYSGLGLDGTSPYYVRIHNDNNERVNIDDIKIYTGGSSSVTNPTTEVSKQTDILEMSVLGLETTDFKVGDVFPGVCTATDMVNGTVSCIASGYNMDLAGTYNVVFTAIDFEGHSHLITTTINVTENGTVSGDLSAYLTVDYTGYYDGIEGLYGEDLMIALRNIIQTGFVAQSYGDARYDLGEIDADPNNPLNVYLIYTDESVSDDWNPNVTWNREHVWPNSRLGVPRVDNSDKSIASDYHNLRACDTGENSTRSNYIFTDTLETSTYYPGDNDKGDVSRILFYMATMYPSLTLADEAGSKFVDSYTAAGAIMGDLDLLLIWNNEDVVDSFETTRNGLIEDYQNNRNPFIDYPYLADLIWNYEPTN